MGQQVNVYRELKMFPGARISGQLGPLYDPGGRTYYVNNITGSSTGQGDSWNDAMDDVDTAVTASEVYRKLQVATNRYIRNTIVIQGTNTAYDLLDDVGENINFIGLGTNMLGYGYGVARIGVDAGSTGGIVTTELVEGDYFYNLQFQAGATAYCASFAHILKTTFEYCGFFVNGTANASPAAGFEVASTKQASGLHLKDCHWGCSGGASWWPTHGIRIRGTHLHNCIVEGCHIAGKTAAVKLESTVLRSDGSVFRDCYLGRGSALSGCTTSVDDDADPGETIYQNCFVNGSTDFALANDASGRVIGCVAGSSFVT